MTTPKPPARPVRPASSDATLLTHAGRDPAAHHGAVNPGLYRASTILFPTAEAFVARKEQRVRYGTHGTPTAHSLEDMLSALEGAEGTVLSPSGLAAISNVLFALLKSGDHLLVPDSAYGPVRTICQKLLPDLGISTTFYDPVATEELESLIRPETRLIWMESPGSMTFEIQDVPEIVRIARNRGILTAIDNSWSGGLFFKPLALGVDVSVQAATKYIGGHSDLLMGSASCGPATFRRVHDTGSVLGLCVGADDAWLALRGLRTLDIRMRRHHETGLELAHWLARHPAVERVLHPGLADDPGHALWSRDFSGASGLFGFCLRRPEDPGRVKTALSAMLDEMALFGMGASWGGFESLLVPTWPEKIRSATKVPAGLQYFRLHAGLEAPADLLADLAAALERWERALA